MAQVARHPADKEWAAEQFEEFGELIERALPGIGQSPTRMSSLLTSALELVGHACVLDPEAEALETWDSVVRAMQLATGVFAAATAGEDAVPCRAVAVRRASRGAASHRSAVLHHL